MFYFLWYDVLHTRTWYCKLFCKHCHWGKRPIFGMCSFSVHSLPSYLVSDDFTGKSYLSFLPQGSTIPWEYKKMLWKSWWGKGSVQLFVLNCRFLLEKRLNSHVLLKYLFWLDTAWEKFVKNEVTLNRIKSTIYYFIKQLITGGKKLVFKVLVPP